MSLILDALNKANDERQVPKPDPELAIEPYPQKEPPTSHVKIWVYGATIFLLVLCIVLFILYLKKPEPSLKTDSVVQQSDSVKKIYREKDTVITPEPPPQKTILENTPREPVIKTSPSQAALVAKQYAAANRKAVNNTLKSVPAKEAENKQVNALYSKKKSTSKTVAPSPQESSNAKKIAEPQYKSIRTLPQNVQDKIPSLYYNEHEFEQQFVVINKKKFRPGSQIAGTLFLEEIHRDGVLLKLEGYRFKLKAYSSWVNM